MQVNNIQSNNELHQIKITHFTQYLNNKNHPPPPLSKAPFSKKASANIISLYLSFIIIGLILLLVKIIRNKRPLSDFIPLLLTTFVLSSLTFILVIIDHSHYHKCFQHLLLTSQILCAVIQLVFGELIHQLNDTSFTIVGVISLVYFGCKIYMNIKKYCFLVLCQSSFYIYLFIKQKIYKEPPFFIFFLIFSLILTYWEKKQAIEKEQHFELIKEESQAYLSQLKFIAETSSDGICILNEKYPSITNSSLAKLFNLSNIELLEKVLGLSIPEDFKFEKLRNAQSQQNNAQNLSKGKELRQSMQLQQQLKVNSYSQVSRKHLQVILAQQPPLADELRQDNQKTLKQGSKRDIEDKENEFNIKTLKQVLDQDFVQSQRKVVHSQSPPQAYSQKLVTGSQPTERKEDQLPPSNNHQTTQIFQNSLKRSQISSLFNLIQPMNSQKSTNHQLQSQIANVFRNFGIHFDIEINSLPYTCQIRVIQDSSPQKYLLIVFKELYWQQQTKIYQDIDKNKNQMIQQLVHDLRTPLQCSISMLEEIPEDIDIDSIEKVKGEMIQPAIYISKMLLNQINDFLDVSALNAGKLVLNFNKFYVQEKIYEIINMFKIQSALNNNQITVEFDQVDSNFTFNSDFNRIRQILINLIGNSMKFTQNGSISLSVKRNVSQNMTVKKNILQISVADTGCGIKRDKQNQLFQQFGVVSENYRNEITSYGTGLGLYITNNLVKRLGSNPTQGIQVTSEENKGTTMSFDIIDQSTASNATTEHSLILEEEEGVSEEVLSDNNERIKVNSTKDFQCVANLSNLNHKAKQLTSLNIPKSENIKEIQQEDEICEEEKDDLQRKIRNSLQITNIFCETLAKNKIFTHHQEKKLSVRLNSSKCSNFKQSAIDMSQRDVEFEDQLSQGYKKRSILTPNKMMRSSLSNGKLSVKSNFSYGSNLQSMQFDNVESFPSNRSVSIQIPTSNNLASSIKVHQSNEKLEEYLNKINQCTCPKILIVDDESLNFMALRLVIQKFFPECEYSSNGFDAIQQVKKYLQNEKYQSCCKMYKMIVMDLQMIGIDGFETSEQIYKLVREFNPNITFQIVLSSGYLDQNIMTEGQKYGINYFLEKPIRNDAFQSLLCKLILKQQI